MLPEQGQSFAMYSPDRAYHARLDEQGREWVDEALAMVPDGVSASGRVRRAESVTEGLIEAATDPDLGSEAALIVIGASHRGLAGRFTVGSVAAALLHSAPVPVALAPAGYTAHPAITRLTCATGTRQGAEALLDVAVDSAAGRHVPLRIMSLVAIGTVGISEDAVHRIGAAEQHADVLAERATRALPPECPVSAVVGRGESVEDCVRALEFEPSEIVLVGSSRLAGPRRLFIGASANKMLRALPVPMIVVPRDYTAPTRGRGTDAQR
ncbi:universal stress protein [Spelaeicoccus albus]